MDQRFVSEAGIALGAQQLTALLDATQELIAIVSADGTLQFVNGAFHKILGYRPEEVLGRSVYDIVLDVELLRRGLKKVSRETGTTHQDSCRFRCQDGSWRWIEFRCQNGANDGEFDGIVFHGKDVTDVHRMEAERQVNSEVVHALNETANLDQLLFRIHQALKKVMYAENCFVALHEPETDLFHFPFLVDNMIPRRRRRKWEGAARRMCSAPGARCLFHKTNLTGWRRKDMSSWSALRRRRGSVCR